MKPHPFDPVSFVPAVLFLGVAAVALAGQLPAVLGDASWVWPAVLIAAGVALLASVGRRDRDAGAADEAPEPAASDPAEPG